LRSLAADAIFQSLALDHPPVTDMALDCGFTDPSNFNRTFRAEFGTARRTYRAGF